MTFMDARAQYRRTEAGSTVLPEDPHQIIQVTLRELERSLNVLARCVEEGRPCPDQHLNRAFTAIYILQSSLDFEKGGEIASNLFSVYEYCRLRVVEAFQREACTGMGQAAQHISAILAAWTEMGARIQA